MGTRVALILAIVMGFIAFIGMKSMVQEKERALDETAQPVTILAAKTRIKSNQSDGSSCLSAKNTTGIPVQAKYVVAGMIPYNDRARFFGKEVVTELERDKPIFDYMLKDTNKVSLSRAVVENGQRAVTIGVDQIKGVAGLIKPGDYVDVVGTFAVEDLELKRAGKKVERAPATWKGANDAGRVTKTVYILQAAFVLAVDNRTFEVDYSGVRKAVYRTVTLQVNPDDALRLIDSTDKGKVQLILRNRSDTAPATCKTANQQTVPYNNPQTNQPLVSVDITNEIYKTQSKE